MLCGSKTKIKSFPFSCRRLGKLSFYFLVIYNIKEKYGWAWYYKKNNTCIQFVFCYCNLKNDECVNKQYTNIVADQVSRVELAALIKNSIDELTVFPKYFCCKYSTELKHMAVKQQRHTYKIKSELNVNNKILSSSHINFINKEIYHSMGHPAMK